MALFERNYDVFLNFRGEDVRNNFLSHLYEALKRNGIHTFKDSEELWKGEQISPALMRAIEESRVAIIVFSKDYASSPWCLKELAKIMECKAQKGLIVLPVFYKVEPREVREGREAYKEAMTRHESKFGKDSEIVKGWKKALLGAGKLSGWPINNENEAEIIQDIVKKVSSHLERALSLHVAEHQVGIDSRVQAISLLQKESDDDDVLMIGLWGPGGIGKTMLAKAIFNTIKGQFQGFSFLGRVRETWNKSNGPVDLQQNLLSQILSPNCPRVYTEDEGIILIKTRLCNKKILLVLDDVNHSNQLGALAGGSNWFGKGSRIFVTTKDQHLLTSFRGKSHVYRVNTLKKDEALDLFVWHAFPNGAKAGMREDLIRRALDYASGLPLALKVLGSFLNGRDELEWESALDELSKKPHEDINGVVELSLDGLGNNEKGIFLDIACFFKGKSVEYIKEVLDGCGFGTTIGIQILIERSLIINEDGTLQMHDSVQKMGKNIVMKDDLEKRSRLWLFEDVLSILDEDTEKKAVEAIVLDLSTPEEITMSLGEITIKADAFRNMKKLRMLILPEVHIPSEGPVCLPNNLRWLEWPNSPSLEFSSVLKKLVGLHIPNSHIRRLEGNIKHFGMLKYVNFSECKSLVSVLDFSSAPNLERLYLDGCKSLTKVDQSIACLNKLKILSLQFCSNLTFFPNTLKTKSLIALDLFGCSKLKEFSDIPEKMKDLEELDLGLTAIKGLSASIENLPSVKIINLRKCKRFTELPSSVYKLQNLEHLNLAGCSKFDTFPKNSEDSNNPNGNSGFQKLKLLELNECNLSEVEFLENSSSFPKLRYLDLSRNKFTHLPTCINKYKYLEHLHVDKCKKLQKIPQLPPKVHVLSAKGCRSLQELPDLSSLSSDCCLVELSSCRKLFRKGANMAHALSLEGLPKMRNVNICVIGSEMPEWFSPGKDSSISFTVSRDSYDKFLGLALCSVFRPKGGKAVSGCGFARVGIHVNGHGVTNTYFPKGVHSIESDHVWVGYFRRSELWVGRKRLRDDCCHFQVNFAPETEVELKECGFRPICEQQEDDQRIMLRPHQPMKTNWLSERDPDEDNWRYTAEEEESSSETDDELIEAIDQEKRKPGLFKADKIGPSEERDSEEDNSMDTEEEESSSEADDELIEPIDEEKEEEELWDAEKIHDDLASYECEATGDLCRSLKTLTRERFLRKKYQRTYHGSDS